MKFRLLALILGLSLIGWAQEPPAASNPNSTPKETKGCCHHGAGEKGAMACGHHAKANGKEAMQCCGKDSSCCTKDAAKCEKDGKSCCGGKDMKACAGACKKEGACANGTCCGVAGEKSAMKCCSHCEKKAS
jgi:hypothetical protein